MICEICEQPYGTCECGLYQKTEHLPVRPESAGSVLYVVEVENEFFGNKSMIMTKDQIKNFNLCAFYLSDAVDCDGKEHKDGMWTVKPNSATGGKI